MPSTLRSQDLKRGIVKGMLSMIFHIVFDSDFTFHYEIDLYNEEGKLMTFQEVQQQLRSDKKRSEYRKGV